VQEVVVPCAGRLQPEHLLKTFEGGATPSRLCAVKKATATITKATSVAVGELRRFLRFWQRLASAKTD